MGSVGSLSQGWGADAIVGTDGQELVPKRKRDHLPEGRGPNGSIGSRTLEIKWTKKVD